MKLHKTIEEHSRDCAHYGDSIMPCTCGAEPEIVGKYHQHSNWSNSSVYMTLEAKFQPDANAVWRITYDFARMARVAT